MWNRPRRFFAKNNRPSLAHLSIELLEVRDVPAAFTAGDLAIYRVGDGSAALTSAATAVFIDEYTTGGDYVQSFALPTADSGSNQILTASGTAFSEGLLTLSTDSRYLLLTGYDAALGTATVTGTTSASVNRVVGRVDANGNIDTTTALTNFSSGASIRGAASTNGTDIWVSGAATGVAYTTLGSTSATQISTTVTNIRGVEIFDGQLYVSSNSGAIRLGSVGTGLPTVSGKTITNLNGFPTTGSPYGFFFADLSTSVAGVDTLYVADDTANAILKYTLVGTTWTANGTGIGATSVRGLTGVVNGSTVMLYSTNGTNLSKFTDSTGYNGSPTGSLTTLATAATNTAFRGVAFVPVSANNAPSLNGANNFNAINEDDTNNSGTLVSALISGKVTDADGLTKTGIALTATATSNGAWQYTTDGSSWNNVGTVSNTSALLLAADSNTRLRFVPNTNFNGTVGNAVTFRAWDQSSGAVGSKVSTSSNGGNSPFSSTTASPSITVNAVNDAPTLSGSNDFSAIDEDDTTNSGTKVSDLLSGKVNDVDSGDASGVAVTATLASNGTWEYTTDGSNWADVGSVSESSALLLKADANTRLRFVPGTNFNGTVSNGLTFRAWDQTGGTAGDKVDTSGDGLATAFSTATASASITVNPVNDAPTHSGANDFSAIDEDDTTNAGTLVSVLISGQITDVDDNPLSGIAVTGTATASGSWDYSTDGGGNWNSVGAVSDDSALLLKVDSSTRLRFVPNADFNGTVTGGFTFRAWDRTSGTAGSKVSTSSNGGTTAFSSETASSSITVNAINDAPTLHGANNLTTIQEDDTANGGTKVSDLISSQVSDPDANALTGIALTATETTNGVWQYSTDGSNWNNVGTVSDTSAILLKADSDTRLRFVPNSNFNGTVGVAVTFRAWDQTGGAAGSKVSTSATGGATPFSTATASSSIRVNAVNDAPVLDGANDFSAITEDDTTNAGTLVSAIISGQVTDPDGGPVSGIAVTATNTGNGVWQYTVDGGSNWTSVGPVSDASALLLAADANTRLRFVPTANFNGTVSSAVTFRAWDQTSEVAGTKVDVSTNGGAAAFSGGTASASVTVNAVNDRPSVTLMTNSVTVNQDTGTFSQSGFATFSPGGGADEAGQSPTYALTNTNNALFTASGQPAIDENGNLTFTPAPGISGSATVTVNVTDSGSNTPPSDNTGVPVEFTINVNAVVGPPVATRPVSVAGSSPASTTPPGPRYIAIGSDAGTPSRVQILSATTGAVLADFSPFGSYSGGVRVAIGDLTGDGTDDIVIATAGTVGMLEVIDGRTGALMGPITPFGPSAGGFEIALGDIDGDGRADLLVGVQDGGSSVMAFTSGSGIIGPVEIFPGFTGGVRLALGDVNGDGRADLAITAGPGGDGLVYVFDGTTGQLLGSFTSHPGFPGEVNLAVGDIDGDGRAEVLTAVAAMFGTEVDAFTPQGGLVRTINTPTIGATTGFARTTLIAPTNQSARIAAADLTGDHIADILLGSTPGNGGSRLLILDGATGGILVNRFAFDPLFDFGVSLGVK